MLMLMSVLKTLISNMAPLIVRRMKRFGEVVFGRILIYM